MTNRSVIFALCLGLFLAATAVPAWAMSLSDVINTLETPFQTDTNKASRIFDYSADFLQESKIASLDRLQHADGRVEVAFDDRREQAVPEVKFRWQYDHPTTQEIVSDGKTLWVYLPENNQVIQSDVTMVNQTNQNDPLAFLTGLGNLSRDFEISWAAPEKDNNGNYVLELTPRRVSSLISRLIIVVDRYAVAAYQKHDKGAPKNLLFPIISTTIYDPNGNSTIIEFRNLRVNLGIPEVNFNFILPAGVQVVKPTGQEFGD